MIYYASLLVVLAWLVLELWGRVRGRTRAVVDVTQPMLGVDTAREPSRGIATHWRCTWVPQRTGPMFDEFLGAAAQQSALNEQLRAMQGQQTLSEQLLRQQLGTPLGQGYGLGSLCNWIGLPPLW